jgi:hypothetical protein
MKKLIKISGLLIGIIAISLSSCKKLSLPSMNAKFNDSTKNFIFRTTFKGTVPTVGEGILILATTSSDLQHGEYLTLLIRGVEEKTYKLDVELSDGKYECGAVYRMKGENDTTNVYVGNSGTITITKIDTKNKKISGTFSFNLVNSKNQTIKVTDGVFKNLLYQEINANLSSNDFKI